MNAEAMRQAIEIARLLADAAILVWRRIKEGRPERVDEIVPSVMRTTLARAIAEAEAEDRFGTAEGGDES